ncbi:MAG: hypothetical protein ACXV5T_09035 [Halobacteriota archaeon]
MIFDIESRRPAGSLSSNEAAANAAPLPWQEAHTQMKRRHADFAKALQENAILNALKQMGLYEFIPEHSIKFVLNIPEEERASAAKRAEVE